MAGVDSCFGSIRCSLPFFITRCGAEKLPVVLIAEIGHIRVAVKQRTGSSYQCQRALTEREIGWVILPFSEDSFSIKGSRSGVA